MTETDLCNLALGFLGHDRVIEDLADGSSEAARCALFLPGARRAVMAAHDWGFLMLQTPLAKGAAAPDGLHYVYMRPFEALRVCGLYNADGDPVSFAYVNGVLLSAAPEAAVAYTLDNDMPDDWPPKVQDAVAWELAARLAGPLTGKTSAVQMARQAAGAYLRDARAADSNETRDRGEPGNRYADARG